MPFKDRLDQEEAKMHCEMHNGTLASARNEDHLSFLASIADPRGSWLGVEKILGENAFRWENEDVDNLDGFSDYWAIPGQQGAVFDCGLDPQSAPHCQLLSF